ncbi:CaiB/BaiF CoA transferase family protein [Sphingomonas immobilis]|uniref:CoA transferase n=1 Tax=Sphingomonas immobilis TaxID=3063997 RepID=A0ABT9A2J2_9SPHN|nr:CoA transferase [Sphingomonas sp. CA1-15]MDO7843632.1 CoA transferase [Sphingomonas sp. CA1-15]
MFGAPLPLDGVRILDMGRLFAAPFATQMLGDFGAEVFKIERPGRGDEFRHYGPPWLIDEMGNPSPAAPEAPGYVSVNRNKYSLAIDFQIAEGAALIRDLARKCDVFVENYKVGTLARYGLDYDTIRALNPNVIYLSITGFGQTGPYAPRPGTDIVFQSMSGLMSVTGEPDGPPVRSGIVMADMVTGFYAVSAILAALRAREVQGHGGQFIDLALLDSTVSVMTAKAAEYFMTGTAPHRTGNRITGSVPAQIFECADGLINCQASADPDFVRLCDVLGITEVAADPRFVKRADRAINADLLIPLLAVRFAERHVTELYEALVAASIIAAPIYSLDQTFADPQVKHRGLSTKVQHAHAGEIEILTNPVRFHGEPLTAYRAPPTLGQDTEAGLTRILGVDAGEIGRLRRLGAIAT